MIRLTRPDLTEVETRAVVDVLASGNLVQGDQVKAFEETIAKRCGRKHAIAMHSGTSALSLALEALDIGPGDDVLVPDLTWPSPANAIILRGANAVLVDVDPHTWNGSPETFAAARTERTKAAIVIHQFGAPAPFEAIARALEGLVLIEDAACGMGSTVHGRACGSSAPVGCFSFHPRKVVTTGEGGACVTDNDDLADRIRIGRNHGQRNPGEFVAVGAHHRLTEMGAAMGVVQMNRLDAILARRNAIADRYRRGLPKFTFQELLPGAVSNYQTMGALLPKGTRQQDRELAMQHLKNRGIEATRLSFALHRLPSFAAAARQAREAGRGLHVSEELVDRGFAMPMASTMTDEEVDRVIDALKELLP